jgi:hypothetical protein
VSVGVQRENYGKEAVAFPLRDRSL